MAVIFVHNLDHLRHFLAWGFNPYTWFGNLPADLVAVAVVLLILWLRILSKDVHANKSWRQILHEEWQGTVHALEGAEEAIAEDVVEDLKEDGLVK